MYVLIYSVLHFIHSINNHIQHIMSMDILIF